MSKYYKYPASRGRYLTNAHTSLEGKTQSKRKYDTRTNELKIQLNFNGTLGYFRYFMK